MVRKTLINQFYFVLALLITKPIMKQETSLNKPKRQKVVFCQAPAKKQQPCCKSQEHTET